MKDRNKCHLHGKLFHSSQESDSLCKIEFSVDGFFRCTDPWKSSMDSNEVLEQYWIKNQNTFSLDPPLAVLQFDLWQSDTKYTQRHTILMTCKMLWKIILVHL